MTIGYIQIFPSKCDKGKNIFVVKKLHNKVIGF